LKQEKHIYYQLIIVLLGLVMFVPYLGGVHLFDWDEINFAESAREMIVTGNYLDVQIDFKAFWEKPPLFIWLQVLSMKLFGVNEFAARFPNALVGIATLLTFFQIGKKHFDLRIALLWPLVYVGSILPFLYFKSGIIDPLFNLFIFLSVYQFYLFDRSKDNFAWKHILLSAAFNGLGILTKGPVAFLIFGLTAFVYMILFKRYKAFLRLKVLALYASILAFVGGFWFILQMLSGNTSVIVDFIEYQIRLFQIKDAGHGGFLGYHFVILFFGVFPASIFAIRAMGKWPGNEDQQDLRKWMLVLFWVVLILFTIVKTKIIHYSSLAYFPLGFLAVLAVKRIMDGEIRFTIWMKIWLFFIAFVWGSLVAMFRWVEINKASIIESGSIQDPFAIANLQAEVHWPLIIPIIAITFVILIGIFTFSKINIKYRLPALFIVTMLFMQVTMTMVVPRVEAYSQRAAIEFYEQRIGEDCYIETFNFKSYAKYFYTQKQPEQSGLSKDELLEGKVEKPVYFVCKVTRMEQFEERYKNFELLYEKNGFAFYKRIVKTNNND
jgi:hypothetical protein